MIYETFSELKDGYYYFAEMPYMDGYDLFNHDTRISPKIKALDGMLSSRNRRTNEPVYRSTTVMDESHTCIIGDTEEEVKKEKLKVLSRLKKDLRLHCDSILSAFDSKLSETDYNIEIEKYPEVLI